MNRKQGLSLCALLAALVIPHGVSASIPDIDIGIYNVQNLFDTRHDKGKRDFEFLPKKHYLRIKYCKDVLRDPRSNEYQIRSCKYPVDWNAYKLDIKIKNIKEIFQRRKKGLPDVLVLSEVENQAVVRKLAAELGYTRSVISNGPDKRGIDLAFLFRGDGPVRYVNSHSYRVNPGFATRPILEIELEMNSETMKGKSLFMYANHWPAQSSKGNTRTRLVAAQTLRKIMHQRKSARPESFFMAMGDFNTTQHEHPNPIDDTLLDDSSLKLFDADKEYRRAVRNGQIEDKNLPEGSYYWKGDARVFDRFIFGKNLYDQKGLDVKLSTYDIFARDFNSKPDPKAGLVPKRYNHYSGRASNAGYSDHYPVFITIGSAD